MGLSVSIAVCVSSVLRLIVRVIVCVTNLGCFVMTVVMRLVWAVIEISFVFLCVVVLVVSCIVLLQLRLLLTVSMRLQRFPRVAGMCGGTVWDSRLGLSNMFVSLVVDMRVLLMLSALS